MIERIDSPGGHILVCCALLVAFVILQALGYAWAHDCMMQAQGAVYVAIQIRRQ